MILYDTYPDIYHHFLSGYFAFQKFCRTFSKIAHDQVHQQNNEKTEGVNEVDWRDEELVYKWC